MSETKAKVAHFEVSVKNDLSKEELARLEAIIASKRALLKKALKANDVSIKVTKEKLSFPWFTLIGEVGETKAYAQLIEAMIRMAKKQSRVTAKERHEENEKLAMRLFTVRLGMLGDEYKLIRHLLTKDLPGDNSYMHGKPEKADNKTTNKISADKPSEKGNSTLGSN